VLRQGDVFTCRLASCGEIYYVLSGAGHSQCAGERIEWRSGDAFCLPGSRSTSHGARSGPALLLVVTNEPEMARLCNGAMQSARVFVPPTHFLSGRVASAVDEVHGREGEQLAAGKSVVLVSAPMAALNLTTPTILASFNTLEPGGDQRPHQHNSVALTLSIQGEGVHSMIDGRRIDWIDGVVSLTPPGAVHSHHNRGSRRMVSFVAQDTGLHTHLRTTGFRWTDI
jgi:gentisate 1,2-dioxygenase